MNDIQNGMNIKTACYGCFVAKWCETGTATRSSSKEDAVSVFALYPPPLSTAKAVLFLLYREKITLHVCAG